MCTKNLAQCMGHGRHLINACCFLLFLNCQFRALITFLSPDFLIRPVGLWIIPESQCHHEDRERPSLLSSTTGRGVKASFTVCFLEGGDSSPVLRNVWDDVVHHRGAKRRRVFWLHPVMPLPGCRGSRGRGARVGETCPDDQSRLAGAMGCGWLQRS